jgi:hypothetical protein
MQLITHDNYIVISGSRMSATRIHSAREKYMKIKRLLNALAGVLADIDAGFVQARRAAGCSHHPD